LVVNEALRVSLISLGCARNLVDSEVILGHAVEEGFLVAEDPEDADVVVVNTCGFVEAAKQESIDTVLSVCELKKRGVIKGVVAVGCLTQRYGDELREAIPEVDVMLPISDYSGVPGVIRRVVNGSAQRFAATVDGGKPKAARSDANRLLLTPKSYSYLRISEGCDHGCTFCAIPKMRGKNRSKPLDVLVEETRNLVKSGVKEVVVVAEDSTAWGLDLERKRLIHELVVQLADVDGLCWLRLMYAYPHTVRPELTRAMREHERILPYLDIPIQHVSGKMLRAMKRGVSKQQVSDTLWRLRDEVPGIAVRSTLITGFPGETEADFRELLEFVEDYRFERLGVFTFSREEGTGAYDLPDQVDPEVAEARRAELMAVQKSILDDNNRQRVGQTLEVLVDGRSPDGEGFVARTHADAPEVDCVVKLPAEDLPAGGLHSGDLIRAEIVGVDDYDLVGRVAVP
jgi:ribosomal protein S12 methylthiotransferase